MSSRVAVVIVNWNGGAETTACLRSLGAIREEWSDCIVVDNGSLDDSVRTLRAGFPWARVIEAGGNLGYAGGNNRGIREALDSGAEWIVVLNNDTTVHSGFVDAMRSALERDSRLGIVGPQIRRGDGSGRFWYAGGQVLRSPYRSRWITEVPPSNEPLAVDYVPGCALMASRRLFERIGLFDERFFLMWEDADLSARAHQAEFGCAVIPGSVIEHRGSVSFDGVFSPLFSYYYFRNMLLYARLHFPRRERATAYRHTLAFAWRNLGRLRGRRDRRRVAAATALGVLHFVSGIFGPAPSRYTTSALRARLNRRIGSS